MFVPFGQMTKQISLLVFYLNLKTKEIPAEVKFVSNQLLCSHPKLQCNEGEEVNSLHESTNQMVRS